MQRLTAVSWDTPSRAMHGTVVVVLLLCGVRGFLADGTPPGHNKTVACYLATWMVFEQGPNKFDIPDAVPGLAHCTHLVYMYVGLEPSNSSIKSTSPYRDFYGDYGLGGISKTVALKEEFPWLKVLVSIGGWEEGSVKYSEMAAFKRKRTKFVKSVVEFLRTHDLDGIDIAWMYPTERDGSSEDRENLVLLVKELREALDRDSRIVTLTVNSEPKRIKRAFDVVELSRHAAYLAMMGYEYHGYWQGKMGVSSPLRASDGQSIEDTFNLLKKLGVPPEKLLLGVSNWGLTYVLKRSIRDDESAIGEPSEEKPFQNGYMTYNEICTELRDFGWKRKWDNTSMTPYIIKGRTVVSYDDAKSIRAKMDFAVERGLGGAMLYSLDWDDFDGSCQEGGSFPNLAAIHRGLLQAPRSQEEGVETTTVDYTDLLEMMENNDGNFFWGGSQGANRQ